MEKLKMGTVILHGDKRCLNRCTFCNGDTNDSRTVEEKFSKFKEDAKHFLNKGYNEIEISGNDPIQYSKIVDCVKFLKDIGIKKIVLSTHGRNMKDEHLTKNLAEAGLTSCRIPLYGSTADVHNQAMQYVAPGEKPLSVGNSFNDTVEALKMCSKYDIFIKGHIIPMQFNQHDISNTVDLYLELTSGKMENLVVASACISHVSEEYTSTWYLPLNKSSEALKSVLNHKIKKDYPHIFFRIIDYPFCTVGALHPTMLNEYLVPDLGKNEVSEVIRSSIDSSVPHYRIKTKFSDCSNCVANKVCAGVYKNDMDMFGTEGLIPITPERLLEPGIME